METCPCSSNKDFKNCCGPLINGETEAASPEELMRSRYTAFYLKNMDYILETTDPQEQHVFDFESNKEWAENSKFIKLEILNSSQDKNKGTVEFKAHYIDKNGETIIHHEHSKFRKHQGTWYFKDGKVLK